MSIASYSVVPSVSQWAYQPYDVTGFSADQRVPRSRSPRQRDRRIYVRRRIAVAVMALGILALVRPAGAAIAGSEGVPTPVEVERYVVAPGDSYWSIADVLAPEADPRSVVHDLREARDDRPLIPGEVIEWAGH